MTKNISRDELLKVATELLGADLNAHRLQGRSQTIGYFKKEEILKDIIEIASSLIEGVDAFYDISEDSPTVNLESLRRVPHNFKDDTIVESKK